LTAGSIGTSWLSAVPKIGATHARRGGSIDSAHRDPCDRMLAAQATLDWARKLRKSLDKAHGVGAK
jgi:PIN domain nuclease of toxin-antitoxin system